MRTARTGERAAADPPAPMGGSILAAAGIAGPLVFALGVLGQECVRRGRYDPIAQTISELTAGGGGWAQQLNFILFGLLVVAFAIGLRRGLRPGRGRPLGPALVACNGLGLVVAGVFPLQEVAGRVVDPLGVHTVNGVIFFLGIGVALLALSPRLLGDPRWRDVGACTLAAGAALLLLFVALATLALPAGGPLHMWRGLAQRLTLLAWLSCLVVLALRLRGLTMEAPAGDVRLSPDRIGTPRLH